jgi:dihydrofolate synthase / folylpolyglutamate synthase
MTEKSKIILDKLFALHRFGIKPGLERTYALAEFASNPQNKYPIIHVAGTNGKGSVCSFIASVLIEAGYKTGLYTSPHLVKFNERIKVNGTEITDDEMTEIAEALIPESDRLGCTFFEITTIMALEHFRKKEVDIAVIETGLGGRFDSTNIVMPEVCIITSISLEHKEYLGNSLAEIAFEKAGIIKPGVTVVISHNEHDAQIVLANTAIERDSPAIYSNLSKHSNFSILNDLTMKVDISAALDDYTGLHSQIAGIHQVNNLKSAILALESLTGKFNISRQNIVDGIENVCNNTGIESRTKLIRREPPLLLDVSHNPASVNALINLIRISKYAEIKWNIILALMDDKDAYNILSLLKPHCYSLIITKPSIDRAFQPKVLKNIAQESGISDIKIIPEVTDAVSAYIDNGEPLLICGSFYLIGEVMAMGRVLNI